MSSKLRRMMGKRGQKDIPTDPGDIDARATTFADISTPQPPPTTKADPVARDDLSSVPPPPPAKIKANRDSSRKVSPSKSLLDRYKSRSASSHTSSPPTVKASSASPGHRSRSPSPKGTTFKDELEEHTPPPVKFKSVTKSKGKGKVPEDGETSSSTGNKKLRFALPTETNEESKMKKAKKDENDCPPPRKKTPAPTQTEDEQVDPQSRREGVPDHKSRRITRSHVRRTERADSQQHDSINNIIAKDVVTDLADMSLYSPSMDNPPGLMIRKAEASRTPSPRTASAELSLVEPEATQLASPTDRKTSQPTTPTDRPITPALDNESPPIPPKSPRRSSSLSRTSIDSISPPNDSNPPPTSNKDRIQEEPEESKISPVAVRPPLYDATKTLYQQWESDLGSTSRPSCAWTPSKRWTCCKCLGQTIIEQTVCSRMTCKHDRCPTKCRVLKEEPGKGLFSRY